MTQSASPAPYPAQCSLHEGIDQLCPHVRPLAKQTPGQIKIWPNQNPAVHGPHCEPLLRQAVKDSESLRTAVEEVQPERVKLSLRLSQSKPLYDAFKGIKEGDLWKQLSEAQQRIVDSELRDFVLGGVALEVRQHCC